MKILYTNFHPRNGGGHATYIVNLAQALHKQHQITIATPASSRLYDQASRIPGVTCLDTTFSTRAGPMLKEVWRLRHILRYGEFDIIHANGSADHRQLMLARMGMSRPPAIIWTKHNTQSIRSFGSWLRARYGTDGAIGVSEFVGRLVIDSPFGGCPVRTILHGLDTERFSPWSPETAARARAELLGPLPPDTLVLGSVGGTDRDKGWMLLAQALARLAPAARNRFRVIMAGDHLKGSLLEEFRQLKLERHVVFPGLVPDPERILAACDIGFVLSLHEAFSFAAGESLAMGLPTLVSTAGGLPELIRDGVDGWVVPAGDVDAIHSWLLQRLAMPLDPVMARAARARAVAHFSLSSFAGQTLDFYREMIA